MKNIFQVTFSLLLVSVLILFGSARRVPRSRLFSHLGHGFTTYDTNAAEVPEEHPESKECQLPPKLPEWSNSKNLTDKDRFFIITTIFNPTSYGKRYDLYYKFAKHMEESGAQLVTIECIFPRLNQLEFQVTNSKNPFHIQLKSDSVYWMKENLINIAVSRLPAYAKWVSWLDADIYYHDPNWVEQTVEALKDYSVVQMFETAQFLDSGNQVLTTEHSFGYAVVKHNMSIDQLKIEELCSHSGYGWAMSKSTFLRINGLPQYDITGSGNVQFAYSLINRVSNIIEIDLNSELKSTIMDSSMKTFLQLTGISSVESKELVGYVPLTISHYWHDEITQNCQYVDRLKILISHNYNYNSDVRKNCDGLLELVERQVFLCTSLQEDLLCYFEKSNKENRSEESELFCKTFKVQNSKYCSGNSSRNE